MSPPKRRKRAEMDQQGREESPHEARAESDPRSGEATPGVEDQTEGLPPSEEQANPGGHARERSNTTRGERFPVIGIGASAGGLNALEQFFKAVPADSNMAFVVLIHLSPDHTSRMPELLQRHSDVTFCAAEDGQVLQPGHAYLCPPGHELTVYEDEIQLMQVDGGSYELPIDYLFTSLARDRGESAAAVILSGTGTDGTLGLREIKSRDGLALVQSPESAGHEGMPRNAIQTGLVDLVLPPGEMPEKLKLFFDHDDREIRDRFEGEDSVPEEDRKWWNKIFMILRTHVGHDFSSYKNNTLIRRVTRRMSLHQIEEPKQYVKLLRADSGEIRALFKEMLIGVTSFFREPEAFEELKKAVCGQFQEMEDGDRYRVWVPGCSTGQEVYSLAMVLRECMEEAGRNLELQIFGTDVDTGSIEKARTGRYPDTIREEIGEERLKRFFRKSRDHYIIRQDVRDDIVFSVQDLTSDPPFSRVNLLVCRNLLIYLKSTAQDRLLPVFHYSLAPGGLLLLGSSETIGRHTRFFKPLSKKWKLFAKKEVASQTLHGLDFPLGTSKTRLEVQESLQRPPREQAQNLEALAREAILAHLVPDALLVDTEGELLYVHGRAGRYLEAPSGTPTNDVIKQAKKGLAIELSAAVRSAKTSGETVERSGITFELEGRQVPLRLRVVPLSEPVALEGRLLVVIEEVEHSEPNGGEPQKKKSEEAAEDGGPTARANLLEYELKTVRENYQATVEELESSNEELKSTNEELQSANEELQSSNEELESSKEELQSLNEELQTVNSELQSKVEELSRARDDMRNLLNSTEIATIFVDDELKVRRFTEEASLIVNLIETDSGRPLKHVVNNLKNEPLIEDMQRVLETLQKLEKEVQTEDGHWYKMRVLPYRTTDNHIDGLVLTFSSIEEQIEMQNQLKARNEDSEKAWQLVRSIFDSSDNPEVVVDDRGRIVVANRAFNEFFGLDDASAEETPLTELGPTIFHRSSLKERMEAALERGEGFRTDSFAIEEGDGSRRFQVQGDVLEADLSPYRLLLQFIEQ